jgi:hypothetical protein
MDQPPETENQIADLTKELISIELGIKIKIEPLGKSPTMPNQNRQSKMRS